MGDERDVRRGEQDKHRNQGGSKHQLNQIESTSVFRRKESTLLSGLSFPLFALLLDHANLVQRAQKKLLTFCGCSAHFVENLLFLARK